MGSPCHVALSGLGGTDGFSRNYHPDFPVSEGPHKNHAFSVCNLNRSVPLHYERHTNNPDSREQGLRTASAVCSRTPLGHLLKSLLWVIMRYAYLYIKQNGIWGVVLEILGVQFQTAIN